MSLAGRVAPSRVVFGPIETNLARGRALSSRHVEFYAARAAGGAGVIVTEIASVHESDWPYERAPLASECGPGWAGVVRACRPHGALVLAGLGHAGGQGSSAYHRRELWAPSSVVDVDSREVPAAVEPDQIASLVGGFAVGAATAAGAGCDGVELNAGQHSLLRQFLSGLTNLRSDRYAAPASALLREVLAAVRAELGPGRVLGLRLCADELAPWAGMTPGAATSLLLGLSAELDYVVPVRGSGLSVAATRPDGHTPPGFNRELCAGVRGALRRAGCELPVVLQGSVVDVRMAAAALADHTADLVEMTRAQLVAPSLVSLVRAGTSRRIRPSTLSNQHSLVRGPANLEISDELEPDAARGGRCFVPAVARRDVLVAGGGPAGLEAARVAALRGHRVRLVERREVLGGGLRLASALPGRERFGLVVDWFAAELDRLAVEVVLDCPVTDSDVVGALDSGWAVLLATGSVPGPVAYPVTSGGPAVLPAAEFVEGCVGGRVHGSAAAVVEGCVDGSGPAVVWDPIGDWTGVGVAELLVAAGRPVTLVTPDPVVGSRLAATGDLVGANGRLARAGVTRLTRTALDAVTGAGVRVTGRDLTRELPCALVVDCGHRLPDDSPHAGDRGVGTAGDRVAPRTVHQAVLEGRRWAEGVDKVVVPGV